MSLPSQQFLLLLPDDYSGDPVPLIVYHHGSGNTATAPRTFTQSDDTIAYLLAGGYAMASSNSHGTNWGNDAALADYVELYNFARRQISVSRVVGLSGSMGGLCGLLLASERAIPYKGWAGAAPVCNLANMFAGSLQDEIIEAYGIAEDGSDYATKTLGHDPVLLDGALFTGLRMRFYASDGDTTVTTPENSEQMQALVAAYATESGLVEGTGDHNDPSLYPAADMLAFFDRCV